MTSISAARRHFKERLTQRFYVRVHMTLMLAAVVLSGIVSSKVLLEFGVTSMLPRYLLALAAAYAVFLVLIRLWLWYITSAEPDQVFKSDHLDLLPDISSGLSRTSSSDWPGSFAGGGNFSGGGAGGAWGAENKASMLVSDAASSGSKCPPSTARSSGDLKSIFDADDAIVIVVFAFLVAVILGAGAYIVYQAPVLLSEVAFEALLASGLIKASTRIHRLGWVGSVFRATVAPLSLVVVVTLIFGLVAAHYCPQATKIAEIVSKCE